MKTPPFLLGAALLFWGWQSGFLIPGIVMAGIVEGARFIRARWEFSDDEFSRIWTFCALLFLVAAVYAFTSTGAASELRGLIQNPHFIYRRNTGIASARTAAAIFRWLPMLFFLMIAAQNYSSREALPLAMLWFVRRRWRKAARLRRPLPAARDFNISYPYLGVCLFSASIHSSQDNTFFWGFCALLAWGLWPHRSGRFGLRVWALMIAITLALGFGGYIGLSRFQGYMEAFNTRLLGQLLHRGFDPSQTKTSLGQIGGLKGSGEIMVRLEPLNQSQPPVYLREASYRIYKSPTWYAGSSRGDFGQVISTNDTTWVLLPEKTNALFAAKIGCYLPGGKALLPLPTGSGRLENLPAYVLEQNSAGAVLAQGPGMILFDAWFGPGATMDSVPKPVEDLQCSDRETNTLEQVITDLQLRGKGREEAMSAINDFFQRDFSYSLWHPWNLKNTNDTPLAEFLLQTRTGHCEYFATATVLLLRRLHIPARYAVGYYVHENTGNSYVVRQRDAHAWCLVWNEETRTWEDFDTTPASWMPEEAAKASAWQALADVWSWLRYQFSKVRWGQSHLREYLLFGSIPVLVILLYQIFFRRKRRQRKEVVETPVGWQGLDSEFYLIERRLAERGIVRQSNEPLTEWLLRALAEPGLAEIGGPLRALLRLHYRYRFDPAGLNPADREELRKDARVCLERLTAS